MADLNTREKLILAGMEEIRLHGIQGFSLRRAAKSCGVSCAAPYKHFSDKEEIFSAMVSYVNEKWRSRLKEKLIVSSHSVENVIADTAVDYVDFLCSNPHFRSVLMIKETGLDSPISIQSVGLSIPVKRLFVIYGRKKGLDGAELRSRIFMIRSLIYGATIILGSDPAMREAKGDALRRAILAELK